MSTISSAVCKGAICAAGQATFSLLCEKEEQVTSIAAVSIADASLSPACSETLASNVSATSCDLAAAVSFLEGICMGVGECAVDATSVIAAACPAALQSAELTVTARVTCAIPGGLDRITILILALYVAISLGLGATLTIDPFIQIWKCKKRAFLIGWSSQFGFMPLMAFALSKAMGLDPLIAIGAILCGAAPGGATSNLLTYWVDGNTALSIAMSCASTLCSLFMMPLLFIIYVKSGYAGATDVDLPFTTVILTFLCVLIPASLGLLINKWNKTKMCGPVWLRKKYSQWLASVCSAIGFLSLLYALYSGIRDCTAARPSPSGQAPPCATRHGSTAVEAPPWKRRRPSDARVPHRA